MWYSAIAIHVQDTNHTTTNHNHNHATCRWEPCCWCLYVFRIDFVIGGSATQTEPGGSLRRATTLLHSDRPDAETVIVAIILWNILYVRCVQVMFVVWNVCGSVNFCLIILCYEYFCHQIRVLYGMNYRSLYEKARKCVFEVIRSSTYLCLFSFLRSRYLSVFVKIVQVLNVTYWTRYKIGRYRYNKNKNSFK